MDTEQALLDLDSNLNWTLGCGRFVSAFFRKILMPDGFGYDIAMLLIHIQALKAPSQCHQLCWWFAITPPKESVSKVMGRIKGKQQSNSIRQTKHKY